MASSKGQRGLQIDAEAAGVVVEMPTRNGESVAAGAPLIRLGTSERLWVRARTFARGPFESAAPKAMRASGREPIAIEPATFLTPAPIVDPETRIGSWLVDLGEPGSSRPAWLRPGVSVVVEAEYGAQSTAITVPKGAVVEIDTRPFVFVQVDGEHFEKRRVLVGAADGDDRVILEGVQDHERVVSVGGFDIHLAAVMGTVESHRH